MATTAHDILGPARASALASLTHAIVWHPPHRQPHRALVAALRARGTHIALCTTSLEAMACIGAAVRQRPPSRDPAEDAPGSGVGLVITCPTLAPAASELMDSVQQFAPKVLGRLALSAPALLLQEIPSTSFDWPSTPAPAGDTSPATAPLPQPPDRTNSEDGDLSGDLWRIEPKASSATVGETGARAPRAAKVRATARARRA